jgi:hypothetical protein
MAQYLVAIHRPDDYDPSTEDEAMHRDIDALNEEMEAAGVRIFAGGSARQPAFSASVTFNHQKICREHPSRRVMLTTGWPCSSGSPDESAGPPAS